MFSGECGGGGAKDFAGKARRRMARRECGGGFRGKARRRAAEGSAARMRRKIPREGSEEGGRGWRGENAAKAAAGTTGSPPARAAARPCRVGRRRPRRSRGTNAIEASRAPSSPPRRWSLARLPVVPAAASAAFRRRLHPTGTDLFAGMAHSPGRDISPMRRLPPASIFTRRRRIPRARPTPLRCSISGRCATGRWRTAGSSRRSSCPSAGGRRPRR